MTEKKWYASKTLWVNAITIVVGLLTSLVEQLNAGTAITGLALINIVLRFFTKTGLK